MSSTDPFLEAAQKLGEARRILEGVEATALGGVARLLVETVESLARITRAQGHRALRVATISQAASYLKRTPKSFEKVVAEGEVPKRYRTEWSIHFSRRELEEWLLEQ